MMSTPINHECYFMPLYNIAKNHSSYAHSIKPKSYWTPYKRSGKFTKNIISVSQSPHSSLQRKLCNDDFRAVRHAYEKNETRLGVYNNHPENNILPISKNAEEELNHYKKLCENAFFADAMPGYNTLRELKCSEGSVFPFILNANNFNKPNMICYSNNAEDVTQQIVNGPAGQRQFVYYDGYHAVCIDVFKDQDDNISIITIDSMETDGKNTPDDDIAGAIFNNEKIKDGQLSMLNLQTNIQKSGIGCKYFSMALAKQAAKDPNLIPQHQFNIAGAKSKMRNIRHLIGINKSEKILGAAYYKHSHSLTRIKDLPLEKREEVISSKGSLLQRHLQFRVKKTNYNQDINFSQSIDIFRRKQIEKSMRYINSDQL